MRTLQLLIIIASVFTTVASARVGETYDACVARYGPPLKKDGKYVHFLKGDFDIIITFFEGRAESVKYYKNGGDNHYGKAPITDKEIEVLLKANGGKKQWKKVDKSEFPAEDRSGKMWETEDSKLSATYDKIDSLYVLQVFTPDAAYRRFKMKAHDKLEGF